MRTVCSFFFLTVISLPVHAEQCEPGQEVRANVICTNAGGENQIPTPDTDSMCSPGETKQVGGSTATCNLDRRWEMQATLTRPTNATAPANVPLPPRRPTNLQPTPASTAARPRQTPTPAASNSNGAAEALSSCKIAGSSVASSCSSSNLNSNAGNFTSGASQSGQAMNSQQQAQVSEACRQAGQNAQEANNAITTIMSQCQNAISACSNACSGVNESQLSTAQKAELASARSQCSSGNSAMANLQNQQNQVQQASARAQQCLSDQGLGGLGSSAANQTPTTDCTKTPNAPGCLQAKQDCTNPEFAASNEVCRCASGNCSPRTHAANNSDEADSKWSESSGESPTPGNDGTLGDSNGGGGYQSSRTDSKLQAGAGGGGLGLGGTSGTGANKPGLRRMGAPSKINTEILKGTLGSRATGFGRSADSPSAGVGSYTASGSWIPPKVEKEPGTPSMDQFRPKIDADQFRKPATTSMNVHKEIYASHVNMWKQMNLRYVELLKSLDP